MITFSSLNENMDYNKKLARQQDDGKCIESIAHGLKIDEDFWKKFLMLTRNPESTAKLLNVSPEKVKSWHSRIKEYTRKFYENETEIEINKKRKLVNTDDFEKFF